MAWFGKTQLRAKGVTLPSFFDVANLRPNFMASYFAETPPPPSPNMIVSVEENRGRILSMAIYHKNVDDVLGVHDT